MTRSFFNLSIYILFIFFHMHSSLHASVPETWWEALKGVEARLFPNILPETRYRRATDHLGSIIAPSLEEAFSLAAAPVFTFMGLMRDLPTLYAPADLAVAEFPKVLRDAIDSTRTQAGFHFLMRGDVDRLDQLYDLVHEAHPAFPVGFESAYRRLTLYGEEYFLYSRCVVLDPQNATEESIQNLGEVIHTGALLAELARGTARLYDPDQSLERWFIWMRGKLFPELKGALRLHERGLVDAYFQGVVFDESDDLESDVRRLFRRHFESLTLGAYVRHVFDSWFAR